LSRHFARCQFKILSATPRYTSHFDDVSLMAARYRSWFDAEPSLPTDSAVMAAKMPRQNEAGEQGALCALAVYRAKPLSQQPT